MEAFCRILHTHAKPCKLCVISLFHDLSFSWNVKLTCKDVFFSLLFWCISVSNVLPSSLFLTFSFSTLQPSVCAQPRYDWGDDQQHPHGGHEAKPQQGQALLPGIGWQNKKKKLFFMHFFVVSWGSFNSFLNKGIHVAAENLSSSSACRLACERRSLQVFLTSCCQQLCFCQLNRAILEP